MKFHNSLIQKPDNRLRLNTDLNNSLHIMQMSSSDLLREVENSLIDNPAVEIEFNYPKAKNIENIPVKKDLFQHLWEQLDIQNEDSKIVELILANCDSSGYLLKRTSDLAKISKIAKSRIEAIRCKIKDCEPYGIASFDLKECLLCQCEKVFPKNKALKKLIEDHLTDIARNDIKKITRETGMLYENIIECISDLKKLNPRPKAEFTTERQSIILPDLLFVKDEDDLQIRPIRYFSLKFNKFDMRSVDQSEKKIIKNYESEAKDLLRYVTNREKSLLKIAKELVLRQRRYLLYQEPKSILMLDDLARSADLHISTISRILKDKTYEYDGEIFKLSSLLSKKISGISKDDLKQRISDLIRNEKQPLSDSDIMIKLNRAGIEIKRRTVTKYREEMRIPNSFERKKI